LAEQGELMQVSAKPLLLAAERELIKAQTLTVFEQKEAWEAAWGEYMQRLQRLEDLKAQGQYGYQLRMPRSALTGLLSGCARSIRIFAAALASRFFAPPDELNHSF
jgi:hypothetical protein